MIIIGGDFNAKLGQKAVFGSTIGKNSLHSMSNDNSAKLFQIAATNNLLIKLTVFEKRIIHKATWISNDCVTKDQIDATLATC